MPGNSVSPAFSFRRTFARISSFTGRDWYPLCFSSPSVVGRVLLLAVTIPRLLRVPTRRRRWLHRRACARAAAGWPGSGGRGTPRAFPRSCRSPRSIRASAPWGTPSAGRRRRSVRARPRA